MHIPSVVSSPHLSLLRDSIPSSFGHWSGFDVLLASKFRREFCIKRHQILQLFLSSHHQQTQQQHPSLLNNKQHQHNTTQHNKTTRTQSNPNLITNDEDFNLLGNRLHRNPPPLLLRPRCPHRRLRCLRSNRSDPLRNRLLYLPPSQIRR